MHMGHGPREHFEGEGWGFQEGGERRGWKRAVVRPEFISPSPSCCASRPRRHEEKLVAFSQAVPF